MKCINHPDKESPVNHCPCEACYSVRYSQIETELRELLRNEVEAPTTPIFRARSPVIFQGLSPYLRGHITYEHAKFNIIKTYSELYNKLQEDVYDNFFKAYDTAKTD